MPKRRKCLFVIQDGLGDRPLAALEEKTPLESARTPTMDRLVRGGVAGLLQTFRSRDEVSTHAGHMALFNQPESTHGLARGPIEAAGLGILLGDDEIALRCNFASLDEAGRIVDRRAGRIRTETADLIQCLNTMKLPCNGFSFHFHKATEHRAVLIIKGAGLSGQVSNTDPKTESHPCRVLEAAPLTGDPAARRTADLVNQIVSRSREALQSHPLNLERSRRGKPAANAILTRGAGRRMKFESLEARTGIRAACVSGEYTVLGLARLCGMAVHTEPGMTANLDTDLERKAESVLELLDRYDLVYLHLKGCDIAAHDRQPQMKRCFIEKTDDMVRSILKGWEQRESLFLVFASDHATFSYSGEHGPDPIPVFWCGPGVAADQVTHYGERSCRQGGLGRIGSREFISRVFQSLRLTPGEEDWSQPAPFPPQPSRPTY